MRNLMKKANKKGFTLAELLIVVAIIAVLVAIAVPVFNSQLAKSRLSTNKANIRSAISAAEATYMQNGESGTKYYVYETSSGSVTGASSTQSAASGKGLYTRIAVQVDEGGVYTKPYINGNNIYESSGFSKNNFNE